MPCHRPTGGGPLCVRGPRSAGPRSFPRAAPAAASRSSSSGRASRHAQLRMGARRLHPVDTHCGTAGTAVAFVTRVRVAGRWVGRSGRRERGACARAGSVRGGSAPAGRRGRRPRPRWRGDRSAGRAACHEDRPRERSRVAAEPARRTETAPWPADMSAPLPDGAFSMTHHVECVAILEPIAKGA
jgi:hypothetical protein